MKDLTPGEIVLLIEQLEGFATVVKPFLEEVDRLRTYPRDGDLSRRKRGTAPRYHALDYWRMEMLRRVKGFTSQQGTRDWLAGDKAARTRPQLGFDTPRTHYGGKPQKWMRGIPSDGWMSSFRRNHLPTETLARLVEALEFQGLKEKLALPGMEEETLLIYLDGSVVETHATPPIISSVTGRCVNRERITAPQAGYIPKNGSNENHSGKGWNVLTISSIKGTVYAHEQVPIHWPENEAMEFLVPRLRQVFALFPNKRLRVLSADSGFTGDLVSKALRQIGVLANIHATSHSKRERSRIHAEDNDKKRYSIEGYPNWEANGHGEISCSCGHFKVSKVARLDDNGRVVSGLKGECTGEGTPCRSVRIAPGDWRLVNKEKYVRCQPGDKPNWAFGTPLTFNDSLASKYSTPRFNAQEGYFGSQMTTRFKIFKYKRWIYDQALLDLDIAAVVTIQHALSIERARRQNAPLAAPPPARLAA